ncbi:MAG: hypothetical protein ACFFD1_07540 [Candidatus Thorarchaeota archaeon]
MNYKKVTNPLTIIAIFAGLAEIAGTTSLSLISNDLQFYFIWFVMGFPILLVIAFFFTLHKYPAHLYAPGDWQEEKYFLESLSMKDREKSKEKSINLDKKTLENLIDSMDDDILNYLLDIHGTKKFNHEDFKKYFSAWKDEFNQAFSAANGIVKAYNHILLEFSKDDHTLLLFEDVISIIKKKLNITKS